MFAEILEREDVTEDSTFVSLGGDSLSYVEVSVRLEQVLGHLPTEWPTTLIRDLHVARRRCRRTASLDTSVAIRAVAIVLIVGTHAALFGISGGAHLLLAVAGCNFALLPRDVGGTSGERSAASDGAFAASRSRACVGSRWLRCSSRMDTG